LLEFDFVVSFEIFYLIFEAAKFPKPGPLTPMLESLAEEYFLDSLKGPGEVAFLLIADCHFKYTLRENRKNINDAARSLDKI